MIRYEAVQAEQGRNVQWNQIVAPGMWYVVRTNDADPAIEVVAGPYALEMLAASYAKGFTEADDRCEPEPEPRYHTRGCDVYEQDFLPRLARAMSPRHADRIAEALNRMEGGG